MSPGFLAREDQHKRGRAFSEPSRLSELAEESLSFLSLSGLSGKQFSILGLPFSKTVHFCRFGFFCRFGLGKT
jgi:hypothetical protein